MNVEELQDVLDPLFGELSDKLVMLYEDIEHLIQVHYGMLIAVGVVAGLILIHYLLEKF